MIGEVVQMLLIHKLRYLPLVIFVVVAAKHLIYKERVDECVHHCKSEGFESDELKLKLRIKLLKLKMK